MLKNRTPSPLVSRIRTLFLGVQNEIAESVFIGRQRVHRWGVFVYRRLPKGMRDRLVVWAYRLAGPLFRGIGHYEQWRQGKFVGTEPPPIPAAALGVAYHDLKALPPLSVAPGRIAIHLHLFRASASKAFVPHLVKMPFTYDLFVSVTEAESENQGRLAFAHLPRCTNLRFAVVPNRGRDLAPLFSTFEEELNRYDFIGHISDQLPLEAGGGLERGRDYLLDSLFGSSERIGRIFSLFSESEAVALLYPQSYSDLPYQANSWLANRQLGEVWSRRLGHPASIPSGYFDFPLGSSFWARRALLTPFWRAKIRPIDFPSEDGQPDGTLAHCLQRLLGLVPLWQGMQVAVLPDCQKPSWSRWRFEHYTGRRREQFTDLFRSPTIKLVIFDIFDTLLLRPLLLPEDIKILIAKRVGGSLGESYATFRVAAERQARERQGRDVGMAEIFAELSKLSGVPAAQIEFLRQTEESLERQAVQPRPQAVELLSMAVASGKRVVLASDMYLPEEVVRAMLRDHGISGWAALYLSNGCGLRKEDGKLYRHILEREQLSAAETMMVGDNERSDWQIPQELGMATGHILRPLEMARAVPRLAPLVEKVMAVGEIHDRLALGLVLADQFAPVFFNQFDPASLFPVSPRTIGKTILGPLVLSFVQWLGREAKKSGVEKLYFLAREGRFLQQAYDLWHAKDTQKPASQYLVLSRRTMVVPMIQTLDDVLAIAKTRYYPNELTRFLGDRFGVELTAAAVEEIYRRKLWRRGKFVEVADDGNLDHLHPLLAALFPRLLLQGESERPGLMQYLAQMGLPAKGTTAVVDVGYAATIQGRLNRLLPQPLHGYYLLTTRKAESVALAHGTQVAGCFAQLVDTEGDPATLPPLLSASFTLEKLLRADEPQIVRYLLTGSGDLRKEYRELEKEELGGQELMAEIRGGALAFVSESLLIKEKIMDDFVIPPDLAAGLFAAFISSLSAAEDKVLRAIALDDHYCGRGLIK